MATRQRSFFDQQKKVNKPFRPHFSRAHTTNHVPHRQDPPQPEPDIMPGTQTKMKLKAYQFIEGRPSTQEAQRVHDPEKENGPAVHPASQKAASQTPMKSSSQPEPLDKRLPPSTPAPRLPLADLLGNGGSQQRSNAMDISPEEAVMWVHQKQTPKGSQATHTPPGRKRKRAKSSSPVSSQQEHAIVPADQDATSVEKPQNSLRTPQPQADPAADLWQRYASGADAPAIDKTAAFSHLIRDPSPKSPATAGSVGGLRRWASCGVEWPQSANKRRRVMKRSDDLPRHDTTAADGSNKVSKVGALLERMKETLTKPSSQVPDGPSSSSPLPDRIVVHEQSPSSRLAPLHEQEEHSSPIQERKDRTSVMQTKKSGATSSQYGEDDFDEDMFDAVESTARAMVEKIQIESKPEATKQLPKYKRPTIKPTPPAPQPAVKQTAPIPQLDDDEFGDDDDLLDIDVDQITANFDSQQNSGQIAVEWNVVAAPVPAAQRPQTVATAQKDVQVISDDEFGDDDIDEDAFAAVEAAATQAYQASGRPAGSSEPDARTIQRYLVTAIEERLYADKYGRQQTEKILIVKDARSETSRRILLRESWYETPATVDSYVHVTGAFDSSGQCIIDNAHNILVLHPDHLISATVVADSFGCVRRAVLQDRVKATSEASAPMMYGHILHELFQEAMMANDWSDKAFEGYMNGTLPRHYETMVAIGLNLIQVHEHLRSKFPEMRAWAELFVTSSPRRDAVIKGRNGQQAIMSINKLLDVEEHIWSPKYGLKGNVDATIQATINNASSSRTLTLPFELKTGKKISEHHVAQTALYTLLASDRYDVEITEGVLYYLENSQITRVQAIRHELIHLIMKRNELACYVRERLKLPPMLPESRQRLCNHCYAQTTCFLYHKLSEDGTSQAIANKGRFEELIKYLKSTDQDFFKKWDHLLTKEETEMKKFTRELWTMLSKEREKKGRCFGNVMIEPGSGHELAGASKINRFQYAFIKQVQASGFSFTESQITVGEPIVVSDEQGHYALANGYVTHVHKKRITVAVDRRLHNARTRRPGFDSQTNQDFIGVMEAISTQDVDAEPILYRLDKDEFSNGMATARSNVLQIMDDTVYKAANLRAMIVQDQAPRFKASPSTYALQSQSWQQGMNSDQKAAVEKVMAAEDYALVLGMPGTGKTTTIAQIIRALVAQGKSVLLTSYTHTAVDNILLKVRNAGFDILRLGVLAKVHPQVQEFAILGGQQKESLEEVQDAWYKPPVVATTCLGVNHAIFTKRTFDYCIVDEASQITLPVCLGPIRMAKTFILVGDHYQLPPLVQNKDAQKGGLDISLFKLLSERHPEAVVNLEHQYRMCADVMHLSNTLIYGGRLKCGTKAVAEQSLRPTSSEQALKAHHFANTQSSRLRLGRVCPGPSTSCHLWQAMQPSNKVLFFNTDTLLPASREILSGPRITNPFEAALTAQLALTLVDSGINPSEVGVITFYRSQLAELRQLLKSQPGLELHTADKFQGRDKEAVIVSFVRNNEDQNVGELLRDWRRINVAVTRAKTKLIMIGSRRTLMAGGPVLKGLVDICQEKGWMVNLREGEHAFPELATQISGTTQASPAKNGSPRKQGNRSPVKQAGRKALGEVGASKLNQGKSNMKMPEKRGKIGEKGILGGARPVLKDVMNDVLG